MTLNCSNLFEQISADLIGLECWYVSAGGSYVGSSFQLAFGEKIPRKQPLANPEHAEIYRKNEGEMNLLVWSTWRLDGRCSPESSSDGTDVNLQTSLGRLMGSKVIQIDVSKPAWDCRIIFEPYRCLNIFSDHLLETPSFDGNWELHSPNYSVYFGPGPKLEIQKS